MSLCDVHGCPSDAVGGYNHSDFCETHLKCFIADEVVDNALHPEPIHPLLNPDSPHYKMVDGTEAIQHMEMMFSTVELMHWAKITAMKYRLRIGNKDDVDKEALKMRTYEDYYVYLSNKLGADDDND